MNNINELIKKLYDNLIDIVLNGFEEEFYQLVKKEYLNILNTRYLKYDNNIKNFESVYEAFYKIEYIEWSSMPLNMKKNLFLKDDYLNKIIDITSKAYKYAKERLYNNKMISIEEAKNLTTELEKLLENVQKYNIDIAKWYISEGVMDLQYASGQTNNTSLRIGHIK